MPGAFVCGTWNWTRGISEFAVNVRDRLILLFMIIKRNGLTRLSGNA